MDPLAEKIPTPREKRGFWTLVAVQMQNALNEKAAQFLLIPLAAALPASLLTGETGFMEHLLGAIVVLPFILLAPAVGWLSDRFCKARIIQSMAFLQIIVMLAMWFSLNRQDMFWTIMFFTIFAIQATILSPAKKGIVKDIVGSRQLGSASGIIEMSVVLALLIGQIGAFVWYNFMVRSHDPWQSAAIPTLILAATAVPVALASLLIPRYPVLSKKPFQKRLFFEHFSQLGQVWRDRHLRLSALGISYFWFFAGFMALVTIQIAKEQGPNFGFNAALLMAWLSGGVVVGGALASFICRKSIELGLIPMGAFGMAAGTIGMAFFTPSSAGFNACLVFAGLAGAFYLVPLNAYLQNTCKDSQRGTVIAAGNLLDCLLGLIAVAIQAVLKIYLPIPGQMVVLGLLSLMMTVIALRLIPREFVRLVGLWAIQLFYRPTILHADRIPKSGGALLLCNHMTWGDAFFVTLACPRPVRFIVDQDFVSMKFIGWFLELFNSVPISMKRPREAIQIAAEAIREGSIICIFPEGQLTRTGALNPVRRGFELIAKSGNAPVIPMFMDGLWGSWLSFARGGFFKNPGRVPYRFTICFDTPIDPCDFDSSRLAPEAICERFRALSDTCIQSLPIDANDTIRTSLDSINNKPFLFLNNTTLTGKQLLYIFNSQEFNLEHLPKPARDWIFWLKYFIENPGHADRYLANAIQLSRVNALQPKIPLLTTVGHDEPHEPIVAVLWPILTQTPVYLADTPSEADSNNRSASSPDILSPFADSRKTQISSSGIPVAIRQAAGSGFLYNWLLGKLPPTPIAFHDFTGNIPATIPNIAFRPGLIIDHTVISASMARDVYPVAGSLVQPGIKPHARGILLPGFTAGVNPETGETSISGYSLISPVKLPDSLHVGEDGFVESLPPST